MARFTGAVVFRLHLLHGLQSQLRRIQGHGARPLWAAQVRPTDLRAPPRSERGRLVPPQSEILQLLERSYNDERGLRGVVRRSPARARIQADAARNGSGAVSSGRL